MGDRLSQTVGNTTTRYVLDPAAGLTQVLYDGTNSYLYGNGRLAQYQTEMQYFGADGLGSVRQLYDASAQVIGSSRYDPYGNVMAQSGATSVFAFAGEQPDATGLTYLRARYYSSYLNQWIQPDPIIPDYANPQSLNRYAYVFNNPTNLTDSTGLDPNLSGPANLAWCFELSVATLAQNVKHVTAQQAVNICRAAYSKENWNLTPTANLPTSGNELMAWFVNNYRGNGNSDRLYFDAAQPLTKELSKSILIERLRYTYYHEGFETNAPLEYQFNLGEFFQSSLFDTPVSGATTLPLTSFMGAFWVQVTTLDQVGGRRVGFRIDNDTTLASGSHFFFRSESEGYFTQSVEDIIGIKKELADRPLSEIWMTQPVVSILRSRTKEQTPGGGGSLYQTFMWTEKVDDCGDRNVKNWTFDLWMLYRHSGNWATRLDMGLWPDYKSVTQDPPGFPRE